MPYVSAPEMGGNPQDNALVRQVVEIARTLDVNVYLVGGFVRDLLAESRTPKDLDFAVSGMPARQFCREVS